MKLIYLSKAKQDKQRKNNRLIEQIFDEHGVALRRFIRIRSGKINDCEGLVQDVYVRLSQIENLSEKFAGRVDTVRSYLFSIASNLIIDRFRKAQTRHEDDRIGLDQVEIVSHLGGPERYVQNKHILKLIQQTLEKIKPIHRQAFLLSRVENMSYQQISDTLGVSVSTIEKYISAVLLVLREKVIDQ